MVSRPCIFCGTTPVTKEHLWPQWLRFYLGGRTKHLYRHGMVGGGEDSVHEWLAPAATKERALMCKSCNGDWGAALEARSKDVLLPMILGHPKRLSQRSQATVALWAAKTAMVFDRSYPQKRWFIAQDHLESLRKQDEPPSGTFVWLAAYGLTTRIATHVSFPFPYFDPNVRGRSPRGYGATLSIGHLVMQLLNSAGYESRVEEALKETRKFVVPIWPLTAKSRSWPPRHSVDDEGLDALSFPTGRPPNAGMTERR